MYNKQKVDILHKLDKAIKDMTTLGGDPYKCIRSALSSIGQAREEMLKVKTYEEMEKSDVSKMD